jgi:hypothetical protein
MIRQLVIVLGYLSIKTCQLWILADDFSVSVLADAQLKDVEY